MSFLWVIALISWIAYSLPTRTTVVHVPCHLWFFLNWGMLNMETRGSAMHFRQTDRKNTSYPESWILNHLLPDVAWGQQSQDSGAVTRGKHFCNKHVFSFYPSWDYLFTLGKVISALCAIYIHNSFCSSSTQVMIWLVAIFFYFYWMGLMLKED